MIKPLHHIDPFLALIFVFKGWFFHGYISFHLKNRLLAVFSISSRCVYKTRNKPPVELSVNQYAWVWGVLLITSRLYHVFSLVASVAERPLLPRPQTALVLRDRQVRLLGRHGGLFLRLI